MKKLGPCSVIPWVKYIKTSVLPQGYLHFLQEILTMSHLFMDGMSRVIEELRGHQEEAVMLTTMNMVPAKNMEQLFC
jgi:hypothetical protein